MGKIVFAPVCSECGAILRKAATYTEVVADYSVVNKTAAKRSVVMVEPKRCPNCGIEFTEIHVPRNMSRDFYFETDELYNIALDYHI